MSRTKQALTDKIMSFRDDPLGFVQYVFPWGEEGTILSEEGGPDEWQTEFMQGVADEIVKRADQNDTSAIQYAIASGHGIGKSCQLSWIILWFISTRIQPQIVVTASTQPQLTTKTWRELSKWHKLMIHADWFAWTATKLYAVDSPSTWFAAAIPWSEQNSEAFAGTHDEHVLLIFDEASGIAAPIWEVASGACTTPGSMWFCFGNPTQNTGRFADCFGRFRHRWITKHIDSRSAKKADSSQLQQWIDDYGIESDFVKVRVLGQFPSASNTQFISRSMVEYCMRTYRADPDDYSTQPLVMGLDVARYGDNETVFAFRRGRKVYPFKAYKQMDLMQVAELCCEYIAAEQAQVCFVDEGGIGAGVVDRIRQLGYGSKIIPVNAGTKPDDSDIYANRRAEMWGKMRKALDEGMELPDDEELADQLTGIQYGFTNKQQIQLEKKRDAEKRGIASPDMGDALGLTYAENVATNSSKTVKKYRERRGYNWAIM